MTNSLLAALGIIALADFLLTLVLLFRSFKRSHAGIDDQMRREIAEEQRESRRETSENIMQMAELLNRSMQGAFQRQDARMDALTKGVSDNLRIVSENLRGYALQSEQRLENIRTTVEHRLSAMQQDNEKKLEQMRETVDEKLQKTLNERLSQSFGMVSERLEQVYKGLGEMQNLANGVGDLKKVLSNVKTRGILGEVQLGAILEQILAPEQYLREVVTKAGSRDHVEFAVKLPGTGDTATLLPIDAKFPLDAYTKLVEAYDSANAEQVEFAAKELVGRIRAQAKDIRDKYIDPPHTTDFAVLFFPIEGLYAEAVRRGLVETLQRDYKVSIAGPTTMAALLNSLQMGFRTLAIQKRSSEVWRVLGEVKQEFENFAAVLAQTQQRLNQANSELDKLVGVRTRQIQKKLQDVSSLKEREKEIKKKKNLAEKDDSPTLFGDMR